MIFVIQIWMYIFDVGAMEKVSNGFACRSNGNLKGAIGAIDGWLVRIIRSILQFSM